MLVKFIAVDNKEQIDDNYAYIDNIYKAIKAGGLIKSLNIDPGVAAFEDGAVREVDTHFHSFIVQPSRNGWQRERTQRFMVSAIAKTNYELNITLQKSGGVVCGIRWGFKRLEIHYTPKHGSWLDMAEIKLNVMTRQCLSRCIYNNLAGVFYEQEKHEISLIYFYKVFVIIVSKFGMNHPNTQIVYGIVSDINFCA